MAENISKKYLDLTGLSTFWAKVKEGYIDVNAKAIADEKTRAEGEEAKIRSEFAAADAQIRLDYAAADEVVVGKIDAAKTELQGNIDEKVSQSDYDTKVAELAAADKTNADAIAAEKSRAELAEGGLSGRIDSLEAFAGGEGDFAELSSKVNTLIGSDTGMAARAIVQDEVAKQLQSENISESFDTLKEMAEYLSSHPQTVTDMNAAITKNAGDIATEKSRAEGVEAGLRTDVDSKVSQDAYNTKVGELESADAQIKSDFAAADTALENRIKALEDSTADADLVSAEVTRAKAAEDKIEASVGLSEDGSYVAHADKNYINNATNVRDEIVKLDAQVKANADAISAEVTRATEAEEALDAAYKAADTVLEFKLQGNIDKKVDTTVYTEKVTALESDIDTKVDQDTYNAAIEGLESAVEARVLTTTYETAINGLDSRIDALEEFAGGDYVTEEEWEARAITTAEIEGLFA